LLKRPQEWQVCFRSRHVILIGRSKPLERQPHPFQTNVSHSIKKRRVSPWFYRRKIYLFYKVTGKLLTWWTIVGGVHPIIFKYFFNPQVSHWVRRIHNNFNDVYNIRQILKGNRLTNRSTKATPLILLEAIYKRKQNKPKVYSKP
jgi:hypothetical protein